jgi:hypothetical protein
VTLVARDRGFFASDVDRQQQRVAERRLDITLIREPPATGRIWSEHDKGFHGRCTVCNRLGRLWVGRYFSYDVRPEEMPYAVHRSDPVCAFHAIEMQRNEWSQPHWRPSPKVRS